MSGRAIPTRRGCAGDEDAHPCANSFRYGPPPAGPWVESVHRSRHQQIRSCNNLGQLHALFIPGKLPIRLPMLAGRATYPGWPHSGCRLRPPHSGEVPSRATNRVGAIPWVPPRAPDNSRCAGTSRGLFHGVSRNVSRPNWAEAGRDDWMRVLLPARWATNPSGRADLEWYIVQPMTCRTTGSILRPGHALIRV